MKKNTYRIFVLLIYIFTLLFFGVTSIKPGSAIYFKKINIDPNGLTRNDQIYEYSLKINSNIYDDQSILVLEGETILDRLTTGNLKTSGRGNFTSERINNETVQIRFVPISDSSFIENQTNFQIFIRLKFFTSPWIPAISIFLAGGLILWTISVLIDTKKRKIIFSSFLGIYKLWRYVDQEDFSWYNRLRFLRFAIVNTILFSFLYAFMEWFFFVTKQSFMDILGFGNKIQIFLLTGLVLALITTAVIILIFISDFIFSFLMTSFHTSVYFLPIAFVLSCLGLILLDNFTYTVFGFGVVSAKTPGRIIYALAFIFTFVLLMSNFASRNRKKTFQKSSLFLIIISIGLIAGAIISAVMGYSPLQRESLLTRSDSRSDLPNIIMLSNDGLNASHMSVYGYERETTPFMEELAQTSLLMENHFTNANTSTGSDTAILTGKSPFDTRVLYPPNTLQGEDMYEHLPGILKQYGYRTISLGVEHFVDVDTINFRNAFDAVNGQEYRSSRIANLASWYGYNDTVYFISTISERILDRLLHIFFIKEMKNPYLAVTKGETETYTLSESAIINQLIINLDESKRTGQPLFAHVHLISTHGPKYNLTRQLYSQGLEQDENWMTDFYDDAILNYDQTVKEFVNFLKTNKLYDNTILVLFTDHGQGWTVENRIPLLIHFPDDQNEGVVSVNTQNMDIGATLLDFLSIDQPIWMEGKSLLRKLNPDRLLFAAKLTSSFVEGGSISNEKIQPPFYQFEYMYAIQCQNIYEINLRSLSMMNQMVKDHTNPCPETMLYTQDEIWEKAGELLSSFGYDVPEEWGK